MRLYSILISGYKATSRQTLAGCLAQQNSSDVGFEVLFLDNTAGGRHEVMARDLFKRMPTAALRTQYIAQPVPGKAQTQNEGIRLAKGTHYIFLDDDVLPEPDLVLQYDRGFQKHDCGAIQGRVTLAFEDGVRVPGWLDERFRLALAEMDFGAPIIPFEMGLTGASMAFKAELFEKYGLFDERLGPGRSGTLEDQEFSERVRRHGETQLFWPPAHVRHRIPPARVKVRSFAGIGYDVGFSDYFLSNDMIKGGRAKFTAYTLKECVRHVLRATGFALRGRRADAIHAYCDIFQSYGYWKQAMRQKHGPGSGALPPGAEGQSGG